MLSAHKHSTTENTSAHRHIEALATQEYRKVHQAHAQLRTARPAVISNSTSVTFSNINDCAANSAQRKASLLSVHTASTAHAPSIKQKAITSALLKYH
jgi:hypothetical protein